MDPTGVERRATEQAARWALHQLDTMRRFLAAHAGADELDRALVRLPMPWLPPTLFGAWGQAQDMIAAEITRPIQWLSRMPEDRRQRLWLFLIALGVSGAVGLWGGIRLARRYGPDPDRSAPGYPRRLLAAGATVAGRVLVPVGVLLGAYAWRGDQLLTEPTMAPLVAILESVVLFLAITGLTRAALAPHRPAWRLVDLDPAILGVLNRRVVYLAAAVACHAALEGIVVPAAYGVDLQSVYWTVWVVVLAVALLALSRSRLWQPVRTPKRETLIARLLRALRQLTALIAVVAVAVSVGGYAMFGLWLIDNLLNSLLAIGLLALLRGLVHESLGLMARVDGLRRRLRMEAGTFRRLRLWLHTAVDPLFFILGVVVLLPIWGLPERTLFDTLGRLMTGFTIGNVTLSPTDLILSITAFVLTMVLSRRLQRALLTRILPRTRMEPAVRHTLVAGVGYLGIMVALALAIAVLGVDLTNLALVASALSVGIGFGLQKPALNFFSGLNILLDRPIRVGDWIRVGDHEGFVRRIKFLSTEMETWQRASVLLPNSEILNAPVTNMTYQNSVGRIEIRVRVTYDSDETRVMELLRACADAHPQILAQPAPMVLLQDFGPTSMDFELRCHTGSVVDRFVIASQIRLAIRARFRAEGITMPLPRQAVELADASEGRSALARPSPDGHNPPA